ncbi:hypothetical protein CHARACLAT_018272 [Characodon lateralis]|uniref:Uncharacterized protein n=1 Tax=Characodon lateralis TaxID=208331 RepID=A0ABU7EK57_9TELE|nr:hypothetical protein [Characodon lateralis]
MYALRSCFISTHPDSSIHCRRQTRKPFSSDVCAEQIKVGFQRPRLNLALCVGLGPTCYSRKCRSDQQHSPRQEHFRR